MTPEKDIVFNGVKVSIDNNMSPGRASVVPDNGESIEIHVSSDKFTTSEISAAIEELRQSNSEPAVIFMSAWTMSNFHNGELVPCIHGLGEPPIDCEAKQRACEVLALDHVADGLVTEAGDDQNGGGMKSNKYRNELGEPPMTPEEYTELAAKTDAPIDNAAQIRACVVLALDHVADGLVTEAGEFKDVLKKYKFYGKEIDYINLVEELGDILWYLAKGCREIGVTMDEVMEVNVNKLKKRYGEKFSDEKANNRDLDAERNILEDKERYDKWVAAFKDKLGEWNL